MDVELHPAAADDLDRFDSAVAEQLKNRLRELENRPTDHHDSDLIQVRGRWLFRYRMKEEQGGDIDHRAIYDVHNGTVLVYAVFHRDRGYEKGEIDRRF
ncbi:MAG: type II toxin-antitoxin system RelE/ParE family toxin [Candidatus Nanohaloarchaea archaeon]|nr:type II toxin-antitoxin system RelE/ParE family toxin [Candidatus Nanohaloarchaea archaeon]